MLKPTLIILTDQPETFQQWLEEAVTNAVNKAISSGVQLVTTTEPLITKKEACRELNISSTALTTWMNNGTVPFIRLGRRIYFERDQILAAGQSHTKYKQHK